MTQPDSLREAAQAIVDAWERYGPDHLRLPTQEQIDALRAALSADADWPNATRAGLPTRVFEGSSPSGAHQSNVGRSPQANGTQEGPGRDPDGTQVGS